MNDVHRQRRKKHKEKMKQKERIAKKLQTHRPGETVDGYDMELFKLSTIKSQKHLNALESTEMLEEEEEELSDEDDVADEQEGMYLCHVICVYTSVMSRLFGGRIE